MHRYREREGYQADDAAIRVRAMFLFLALACQPEEPPVLAPETHTWQEEGELVVAGLEEVEHLFKAGNKEASRVLAERVYTERWEPRLEVAARKMPEVGSVVETEYAFSRLFVELEGNGRDIDDKVHSLQETARAVAGAASRAFPPPDSAGQAVAPSPPGGGSKPMVPDIRPAWESQ